MTKTVLGSLAVLGLLLTACDPPGTSSTTSFSQTTITTKSAQLSWTASTGVVTGYYVEQSTDDVTFKQVLSVGNVTAATVSGLSKATTYYFRIRAYNLGGTSSYSSVVSVAID